MGATTHLQKLSSATRAHLNELLDEALEETFPASDPIAIAVEPETADPCVAGDILDSVWCAGIIELPKWRQRAMATGIVKWFNPTKGYGFIQPQGGGSSIFRR